MNISDLLKKPLWQMTGEEFMFLSKTAMAGFGLKCGVVASGARHQPQQYNPQQALELQTDIERLTAEIETLSAEKEKVENGAKDEKGRILSWLVTGELPKLEKEVADKDKWIAA